MWKYWLNRTILLVEVHQVEVHRAQVDTEGLLKIRVHCYGTQAKSVTIYENGKTSNGWDVRLNAQGNWQVFGASVGGQYNQGSSSGTGNTSNTVTISNFDFWATRYYCPNQSTSCCTPYDPCP